MEQKQKSKPLIKMKFCPLTGAHFNFNDICKELKKLELKRSEQKYFSVPD